MVLSPRWREHSSSSFTEWSTRQPCGHPCEDTDLAMWAIFCRFTPWVSTSSSELSASSSQACTDLRCPPLPQKKSKRRINVVKLHPRGFEAVILLDSTLRRVHKLSRARLSMRCPSLSEARLPVSLGMEQSVTSLFEAQFTKCHFMSGSLGSSFPFPSSGSPREIDGKQGTGHTRSRVQMSPGLALLPRNWSWISPVCSARHFL